jgi:hypothetical protein
MWQCDEYLPLRKQREAYGKYNVKITNAKRDSHQLWLRDVMVQCNEVIIYALFFCSSYRKNMSYIK